jgi:hypothetical protein
MSAREPLRDVPFVAPYNPRRDWRILLLASLAGVGLIVIGIRFLIWPEAAARFFGFIGRPFGHQMHTVVALRDLWLGIVAVAMVMLREWRLLTVWLAAGALVCFGDAGVIWSARGRKLGFAFHLLSGVFMTVLAILAWRRVRRDRARAGEMSATSSDGGARVL